MKQHLRLLSNMLLLLLLVVSLTMLLNPTILPQRPTLSPLSLPSRSLRHTPPDTQIVSSRQQVATLLTPHYVAWVNETSPTSPTSPALFASNTAVPSQTVLAGVYAAERSVSSAHLTYLQHMNTLRHVAHRLSHPTTVLPRITVAAPFFYAPSRYYAETGHNVGGALLAYVDTHGGIEQFGLPLTDVVLEHGIPAQYFQHARVAQTNTFTTDMSQQIATATIFHLNASVAITHSAYYSATHVLPTSLRAATRPVVLLGEARYTFAPDAAATQNVRVAAQHLHNLWIPPGTTVSFLNTLGALTAEAGYAWGGAIIQNKIERVIAGGICYLSTAVFQALLTSGVDITERHQHSLLLADFNNPPGMDSAVFRVDDSGAQRTSSDLDLVWRNDRPDPILLVVDSATPGVLHVALWGYDDGRVTHVHQPVIQETFAAPAEAMWQKDGALAPCDVQQIAHHSPGKHVLLERVVQHSDGTILHHNQFVSHYEPTHDVFLHGADIQPNANSMQAAIEQCVMDNEPVTYHAASEPIEMPNTLNTITEQSTSDDVNNVSERPEAPEVSATLPLIMPTLYGLPVEQAQQQLMTHGIATIYVDVQATQPDAPCIPMHVVSTLPIAGAVIEPATPIVLGVCGEQPAASASETSELSEASDSLVQP